MPPGSGTALGADLAELHSDIAHVFRPLGDLDDGPERRVWIRPDGQKAWCKAVARLG
jgi:hypothetical protein